MRESRLVGFGVVLLAASVATSTATAQEGQRAAGSAATQSPRTAPRYPVKREQPPPEPAPAAPVAPVAAPAVRPAPSPAPASAPSRSPSTRYPVKTTAPAGATESGAPAGAAPVAAASVEVEPSDDVFRVQGLINEPSLRAVFRGDFARSTIAHDGPLLPAAMQGYLNAFAQRCSESLPANSVEMMSRECATERVTTNGWGVEVSRTCVEWVDVPTGLFADPDLYAAKNQVERALAADAVRSAFQLLTTGNPIGAAMGMVAEVQGARDDMARLVEMNACGGPELKRFGENLRRFAVNETPIRLTGESSVPLAPVAAPPAGDQDFVRLVDDLIADQSRTWVMNRYEPGSVGGASVVSRDAQGRPARLEATYSFAGFSGPAAGSLVLTFVDGTPNCIYFFDSPACRTPSRAVVGAYLDGRYAR